MLYFEQLIIHWKYLELQVTHQYPNTLNADQTALESLLPKHKTWCKMEMDKCKEAVKGVKDYENVIYISILQEWKCKTRERKVQQPKQHFMI